MITEEQMSSFVGNEFDMGKVLLNNKKKKPRLKFNPGLALTAVRTTGPCTENIITNLLKINAY